MYQYAISAGQYVLMNGQSPVGQPMQEVALALDKQSGVLHKHGAPDLTQAWHAHATKALREAGYPELADELVVVTGRFAAEDLNRCLSTTGYAGAFYQRLMAGEAVPLQA